MKIESKILGDSINPAGDRLTTFLVTFPRIILAELNTHRAFSRNSASSRAIPFNKMIESVQNNPFVPIAWQKQHKGMQGVEYITDTREIELRSKQWLLARDYAIEMAESLASPLVNFGGEFIGSGSGVTKQLCNRLLEPFMWHTVIITTSKEGLENFFDLRLPAYEIEGIRYKSISEVFSYLYDPNNPADFSTWNVLEWMKVNKGQAEIHMMALAEAMYDNYNESVPETLQEGEWHIPYKKEIIEQFNGTTGTVQMAGNNNIPDMAYISSVMCARVSYTVAGHDLTEWTYQKYIDKAMELANAKPLHASPFEHCAEAMWDSENYRNFKGFKQLREILETEQ